MKFNTIYKRKFFYMRRLRDNEQEQKEIIE